MSSALVLVVLMAGRDDPVASEAAVRAARSALPPDSSLVVRRLDVVPSAEEAIGIEQASNAEAVAIVVWSEAESRKVRLRVHRAQDRRWIDRDITFEGTDAPAERGRTLGFALASMMPESIANGEAPPPPPPVAATLPGATNPGNERPRTDKASARTPHASLDAAALGALGVDGYGGGLGARVGAAWLPSTLVSVRVDGSLRTAEVAPAQTSAITLGVGPGVGFDFLPTSPERSFGLGARVNLLALLHVHSHLSDEPAPVRQSRWLPGTSAVLEGAFRLAESASVLVSGGTEVAFGKTDVFVEGRKVAVIPPVRLVADAGIRVRF